MKTGDERLWMGLNDRGERIEISHMELLKWCDKHEIEPPSTEMVFQAGPERFVRGPMMVQIARSMGWDDIADELVENGFS